jgi:hypothetical protein
VACHPTWEKTGIPREHTDEGSCYDRIIDCD